MATSVSSHTPVLPQPYDAGFDEKVAKLESTPLFMRSLPEGESEDATLNALQSLLYEGTPDEVAQNFKEQGNESFKEKRYRDAAGFYTQGIQTQPTDSALLEALLCNRAACNLELENYGSVLRDCSKALMQNARCSKAYYRSALALMALLRYEEAVDCCKRCIKHDEKNAPMLATLIKAQNLLDAQQKKQAEKDAKAAREHEHATKLRVALNSRKLMVLPKSSTSDSEAPSIRFDADDSESLVFPVFFLYPQHATSDLISEFHEDATFGDHLAQMLPPDATRPPWDVSGEYAVDTVVVYAVTRNRRLFKVGKNKTLREVIAAPQQLTKHDDAPDGLEVREGCLSFVVLPKGVVEQKWVDEFKARGRPA